MRASEALIAGSTLMRAIPYQVCSVEQDKGCALGMMGKASRGDAHKVWDEFRWLQTEIDKTPCGCTHMCYPAGTFRHLDSCIMRIDKVSSAIAHIFNEHVCGDKTWTIERLAEWIESIDPTPKTVHEIVDDVMKKHEQNGVSDEKVDVAVPDATGVSI